MWYVHTCSLIQANTTIKPSTTDDSCLLYQLEQGSIDLDISRYVHEFTNDRSVSPTTALCIGTGHTSPNRNLDPFEPTQIPNGSFASSLNNSDPVCLPSPVSATAGYVGTGSNHFPTGDPELQALFQLCSELSGSDNPVLQQPTFIDGRPHLPEPGHVNEAVQDLLNWTSRLRDVVDIIAASNETDAHLSSAETRRQSRSNTTYAFNGSPQVGQQQFLMTRNSVSSNPLFNAQRQGAPPQAAFGVQRTGTSMRSGYVPNRHHPYSNSTHMADSARSTDVTHNDNGARAGVSKGRRRRDQDIVITTSLITAYILLRRTWRYLFCHLHSFLSNESTHARKAPLPALTLPGLQLGGFTVETVDSKIQIMVLLELTSSSLGQLEACLGVQPQAQSPLSQTPNHERIRQGSATQSKPSSLSMDPFSALVRETMISRDLLSMSTSREDGYSELSLPDIMEKIRDQLRKA